MTTNYIPNPGDRVRIEEYAHAVERGKFGSEIVTVGRVAQAPGFPGGPWVFITQKGDEEDWCRCRVSPAPDLSDEAKRVCPSCGSKRLGLRRCDGCGYAEPERDAALTGQAPKDSGQGTPYERTPGPVPVSPSGGDSGTGRAAGDRVVSPAGQAVIAGPAAPSGFPPCSVPKCGRPVEHRHRGEGIDPASDAPPEMKARFLRMNEAASMCGDHAELHVRSPKVAALLSNLNHPLPKVVAAERIWPAGAGEEYEL